MQDRYAGDVGDFLKFGLLRSLCSGVAGDRLHLGVCWYLVPDEAHNADGKHISYLAPGSHYARSLEACDPDLFRELKAIVTTGRRSVARLEESGVLPPSTVTYEVPLQLSSTVAAREAWHRAAVDRLASADIVFADPDNGIRTRYSKQSAEKYAMSYEIADYLRRGQSVIVYQHADRTSHVEVQIQRRMSELRDATDVQPVGVIIGRRGSVRYFFILSSDHHRERLEGRAIAFAERWSPHADYRCFLPSGRLG